MLKIMHRLINNTGKYKGRIRASYITAFLKGIMMKAPLVLCFFCISRFMQGQMDKSKCILLGIAVLASVIMPAESTILTTADCAAFISAIVFPSIIIAIPVGNA